MVWLGGGLRGTGGGLAVTAAEVDRAVRFVERGGRLVLGVPHGAAAAAAEGAAFGEILARLKVPIAVEPREVVDHDPDGSYVAALMRAPLFVPEPTHPAARGLPHLLVGARSAPLRLGPGARPILWTRSTAFLDRLYGPPPEEPAEFGRRAVAAAASAGGGSGRLLVASRSLLAAGGTPFGATFEPLLPAALPGGALRGRERLLAGALAELADGLPGLSPRSMPPTTRPAAAPAGRDEACRGTRPGERWLAAEGARIAWGYVDRSEAAMGELLARLPGAGLNALWGPADSWAPLLAPDADRRAAAEIRARIGRLLAALGGTGVRWLAGINVPGAGDLGRYTRAATITGREFDVPSPIDPAFWEGVVLPQVVALGSLARQGDVLAGVVLDLEMYGRRILYWGDGFDFGDAAFPAFLHDRPVPLSDEERARARRLPRARRGDWLLETGRLPAYYGWLEARAEAVGRRLREALDAAAPGRDLVLGFYTVSVLPSWFYRGLWRGASAGGRPVLLLTFQTDVQAELAAAAREGTCIRHALAALLGLVGKDGLSPLLARAAREHDGFWLNRVSTLVEPEAGFEAVETPATLTGDAAWAWLRGGVEAYLQARDGP